VSTAPDTIPVKRKARAVTPRDQAPEKEKNPGPRPESMKRIGAVMSAGLSTTCSSTGVRTILSTKEKVTVRIEGVAFLFFFRNSGISSARTGP